MTFLPNKSAPRGARRTIVALLAAAPVACLLGPSVARAVAPTLPQFAPLGSFTTPTGNSTLTGPRVGAAAAITNGEVLIAGGSSGAATLGTLDLFNPAIHSPGSFTALTAHLTTARDDGYAAPLPGGKVLIGGGQSAASVDLASAEIYDPAAGTVTPVTGQMTTARRYAWAAPLSDGRVLIGGGIDASNNILKTAEIFDPTTGTFTATAQPMVDALFGSSATTLPNGKVLIAGGAASTTTPPTTAVETYDPTAGTFTKLGGGLLVPRSQAVAVTLPDGKVLIAGGLSSPTGGPLVVERSAEIFNPSGATSTELPVSGTTELTTARYGAVAALLPDGEVLIAGGASGPIQPLASAELFRSAPEATVTNPNFGNQATGTTATLSVTITNVGVQNLNVTGFTLGGSNQDDFSVGSTTCVGAVFGFKGTCSVNLHFTPSATGSRVAIVQLSDNESVPLTFIVKGTGVQPGSGSGGSGSGGSGSGGSGSGGSGGSGSGGSGSASGSPVLSRLSIRPGRFKAHRNAGTTIAWQDSTAATTTLQISRRATGRRAGSRCVAPTHANRSHRSCTRYVTLGSLTHRDRAGRDTLHFSGILHGHKLTPGRYRLSLQARDAHGRSRTVVKTFTIAS